MIAFAENMTYQSKLFCAEKVIPTTKLAAERGVVFVVPRFRLGPLGFLPRLLLNDTSDLIKKSADFTVELIVDAKPEPPF